MPLDGLCLLGFMKEDLAVQYLQTQCLMPDAWKKGSQIGHWQRAKAMLGAPIPDPGKPTIEDLPSEHDAYVDVIRKMARFQLILGKKGGVFKTVSIPELLAFQFGVVTEKK